MDKKDFPEDIKYKVETNDMIKKVIRQQAKQEEREKIIKILENWNCQNNPKIRTTINTLIMRIAELKNNGP